MKPRLAKPVRLGKLVNLFATLSLLAVLAAGGTAPPSPSSANSPRPSPSRITTPAKPLPAPVTPASPEAAGTPTDAASELPSSDAPSQRCWQVSQHANTNAVARRGTARAFTAAAPPAVSATT